MARTKALERMVVKRRQTFSSPCPSISWHWPEFQYIVVHAVLLPLPTVLIKYCMRKIQVHTTVRKLRTNSSRSSSSRSSCFTTLFINEFKNLSTCLQIDFHQLTRKPKSSVAHCSIACVSSLSTNILIASFIPLSPSNCSSCADRYSLTNVCTRTLASFS